MKTEAAKAWSIQQRLELIALLYVLSVVANLLVSAGGVLVYLRPAFFRAAVASDARDRIDRSRAAVRRLDRRRSAMPDDVLRHELARIVDELDSGAVARAASFAGPGITDLRRALADAAVGTDETRFAEIDHLFSQAAEDLEIERRAGLRRAEHVQETVIAVALVNSVLGVVLLLFGLRSVYAWLVQPVARLRQATEKIGRGQFDVDIVLPYRDEMAALGERIEHMANQIAGMQALLLDRERRLAASETIDQVSEALKNQLARIRDLVEADSGSGARGDDVASCHARMSETLERLESWLQELHRSFNPDTPVFKPVCVRHLLNHVQQGLQSALDRSEVELEVWIDPTLSIVELDEVQLEHALVALITNAAEASSPGRRVRVRAERSAADHWQLIVRDEGAGIPPEVQRKLFTPFFTTKADGNGIGLGLVKSVLEAHNGRISCVSEPGHGACFTLSMPTTITEKFPRNPLADPATHEVAIRDKRDSTRQG